MSTKGWNDLTLYTNCVCTVWSWLAVPETKGLTLTQVKWWRFPPKLSLADQRDVLHCGEGGRGDHSRWGGEDGRERDETPKDWEDNKVWSGRQQASCDHSLQAAQDGLLYFFYWLTNIVEWYRFSSGWINLPFCDMCCSFNQPVVRELDGVGPVDNRPSTD